MKTVVKMMVLIGAAISSAAAEPKRDLLSGEWKPIASDGVKVVATRDGAALRIDFDFTAGAGFGGAFLDLPMDLPENYEFLLKVRGEGAANNLELKLVDPSLLNVWWVNRRAFEWPAESTRLSNQRRHFHFAWGPSGGAELQKIGRIELIIAANEGGRGTVWIDEISFAPLPPVRPYTGTPGVSASSGAGGDVAALLGAGGAWRAAADDPKPWIAIDFEQPREIGGLVVHRPAAAAPADFDVEVSSDGTSWTSIRRVRGAGRLPSDLMLTDLQTRWVRLAFDRSAGGANPAISRIEVLEPPAGASPNAFWRMRAARASRGLFPRTLLNEQSFWTVIGQPDDPREALINEDGQIEVDKRTFSLEPFVLRDGKLLTWADGAAEQSLRDGWLPMPTVLRKHPGLNLSIRAFASGAPGASSLHAAYTVRNTDHLPARGQMVVAVRPIQVLPPWQDLNITGGWTAVRSIRADERGLIVNEPSDPKRVFASGEFKATATTLDQGDPVESVAAGQWPIGPANRVECPEKSASALLAWDFDLAPGASATYVLNVPFHGTQTTDLPQDSAAFEALAEQVATDWKRIIDRATFHLPPAAKQFADTIRATQAYILINHDGKGFQPGSRTYERSWIRDGSMTSAAMLELGHEELVRRFIDWYAPFQFPSGKVPCVVDRRGADPVPENDSHGQLIWLIANYYRATGDTELVKRHFDRVKKTVAHIDNLRALRLTEEFSTAAKPRQEPGKPPVPAVAFRGLLPESISHEGYSAKPMHSFWDQFYALRGLNDAAFLAGVVGETDLQQQWQATADDFRRCLIESIRIVHQVHGIDYLPGCVELGDFDSTSSTILLWPVDEAGRFPAEWVKATFDRYWSEFTKRRDTTGWEAYTPYELRHIGALIRLGQKRRAIEALDWYLAHQRPAGWRHWAEVVWREPRTPRMIGDMPHTWCGSDFLNAARAMFVYEDQQEQKLVLFAGVPDAWATDPGGVGFDNLRTTFGAVSARIAPATGQPARLVARIEGAATPPGGVELVSPLDRPLRAARIDGKDAPATGGRLRINRLPVTIELDY